MDGPYYQPSADDIGMRICIKCTLAGAALSFGASGGLSPAGGGKGRRGRHARGGGSRVPPQSPQRHQAQVTFAEVNGRYSVGSGVDVLVVGGGLERVPRGMTRLSPVCLVRGGLCVHANRVPSLLPPRLPAIALLWGAVVLVGHSRLPRNTTGSPWWPFSYDVRR